jgi:hypothetical protein
MKKILITDADAEVLDVLIKFGIDELETTEGDLNNVLPEGTRSVRLQDVLTLRTHIEDTLASPDYRFRLPTT